MRGSLRKRSSSSWQILWSTRGSDGKRKQHSITIQGTKRDAERKLTEIIRSVDQGTYTDPTNITLGELLDQWLEYCKSRVAITTYNRYESAVRCNIKPALGGARLTALRPGEIQAVYSKWHEAGASPRTISVRHTALRQALEMAVRLEMIPRNPASAASPPPAQQRTKGILDDKEMGRLLRSSAGTVVYVPIALALTAGLRVGEICGLKWEDIDFEGHQLLVRRTAAKIGPGNVVLKEPKTKTSMRRISLPNITIEGLSQHPRRGELVVSNAKGQVINPNTVATAVKRFCRTLGIDTTIHGLRHTHASLLFRQGIHPKVVSERLGHATIGMTLNIYSHVLPSQQAEAAAKVDEVLALPEVID